MSANAKIKDLTNRCADAKDFLESLLAVNPVSNNTCSTTWHSANNALIILYLDVALHWLSQGFTICQATLERVKGFPAYVEGQEIETVVRRVEAVVAAYKATNVIYDDGVVLVLPSDSKKKRARSPADSGVDVDSPYSKRRRLSAADAEVHETLEFSPISTASGRSPRFRVGSSRDSSRVFVEDDDDDDFLLSPKSAAPKRSAGFSTNGSRRTSRVIDDDSEDEDEGISAFSTQAAADEDELADDDSDEACTPDEEPTSLGVLAAAGTFTPIPAPSLKRRGRPSKINTALAERLEGYSSTSPTSPRTRTTTPKTKTPKSAKSAAPNPQAKHPWEAGWIPIKYNGPRGRPADMPHVPCPAGQNPRCWYGLSYKTQLLRVEGLRMLAEMPETDSEEENGDADESASEDDD